MMRPIKGFSFQVGKSRNLHVANDECRGKYLAYQFELIRDGQFLSRQNIPKTCTIITKGPFHEKSSGTLFPLIPAQMKRRVNCKGMNTSKCCRMQTVLKLQKSNRLKKSPCFVQSPSFPVDKYSMYLVRHKLPLHNRQIHKYF